MTIGDRARAAIENSTDWVIDQRWFGDKARRVSTADIDLIQTVDIGTSEAALAIARFSFEWGPDVRYFIPLVSTFPSETSPYGEGLKDAFTDPGFLRWFVDGFGDDRVIGGEATWTWRGLGTSLPDINSVDFSNAHAISGEQSNTSIVFDRQFIGKMFRRVQPGLNPDLEVGEFLSTDDRFSHAPLLYGVVEVEHDGEPIALAAMQQFVPNRADGWTWLLGQLREMTTETLSDSIDAVRLLATRTAELHVAFTSEPGNEAFAPEPFNHDDAQALIGRVIAEIEESVEGLVQHVSPAEVERIHKGMGELMGDAHSLVGTSKIRVHGDYHLGQTLRTTDDDFMLIDFEGEPSRTMDQRRMKLPALKDVAGMVRSLDYAAATILRDEKDANRRELIHGWLSEATHAFVDAYRDVAGGAAVRIVPEGDAAFADALNLMIAEKALYEVRYELNNRPTWLPIPLNALRRLVGMDAPAGIE